MTVVPTRIENGGIYPQGGLVLVELSEANRDAESLQAVVAPEETPGLALPTSSKPKRSHHGRAARLGQHVVTIHARDWWPLCAQAHRMRLSGNALVALIARNYVRKPYDLILIPEEDVP